MLLNDISFSYAPVKVNPCTPLPLPPPAPAPKPAKGGDIGQKNSKKGTNVPNPRATVSFQWPHFPPPTSDGMC